MISRISGRMIAGIIDLYRRLKSEWIPMPSLFQRMEQQKILVSINLSYLLPGIG